MPQEASLGTRTGTGSDSLTAPHCDFPGPTDRPTALVTSRRRKAERKENDFGRAAGNLFLAEKYPPGNRKSFVIVSQFNDWAPISNSTALAD